MRGYPHFMAYTDINTEDRLVQATVAEHLEKVLGWESVYAWNEETFGPDGTGNSGKLMAVRCIGNLKRIDRRLKVRF